MTTHHRSSDVLSVRVQQRVSEADLKAFAAARGLPAAYVPSFYSAMRRQGGPLTVIAGIDYPTFRAYVTSREDALRRSFDHFDSGALPVPLL